MGNVCVMLFLGDVVVCQTLFPGKGIISHMAPKVAVANIKNLIVSSTENGCQDHSSMLDAYKRFDKYLDEENMVHPVVVRSDGHSSRFDFAVLKVLHEKSTHSFIMPPDTTVVTQLVDQNPNTKLHQEF